MYGVEIYATVRQLVLRVKAAAKLASYRPWRAISTSAAEKLLILFNGLLIKVLPEPA
jgi:hypothetical protein